MSKFTFEDTLGCLLGIFLWLIAFGLLGYEGYTFLRYGKPAGISVYDFFSMGEKKFHTDWAGIQWIIEKTPLWLAFLILGMILPRVLK